MKKFTFAFFVLPLLAALVGNEFLAFESTDAAGRARDSLNEATFQMTDDLSFIDAQPDAAAALREARSDLDITLAAMQQENGKIVAAMFRLEMPANQIALVQRQTLLIERMARSIDKSVLSGDTTRLPFSFEINSDRFQTVLRGLTKGDRELLLAPATDSEVRRSLSTIGELYAEVPGGARRVLKAARLVADLVAKSETLVEQSLDALTEMQRAGTHDSHWRRVIRLEEISEAMSGSSQWADRLRALLDIDWSEIVDVDQLQMVLQSDDKRLISAREHQLARITLLALLLLLTLPKLLAPPIAERPSRQVTPRGASSRKSHLQGGAPRKAAPGKKRRRGQAAGSSGEAGRFSAQYDSQYNWSPFVNAPEPQVISNWVEAGGDRSLPDICDRYQQTLNAILRKENLQQNMTVLGRLLAMLAKQGGDSPLGNVSMLAAAVMDGIGLGAIRLDNRSADLLRRLNTHLRAANDAGSYGLCVKVDENLAIGLLKRLKNMHLDSEGADADARAKRIIAAREKFLLWHGLS